MSLSQSPRRAAIRYLVALSITLAAMLALAVGWVSLSASISPFAAARELAQLGEVLAFGRSIPLEPARSTIGVEEKLFAADGKLTALNAGARLLVDVSGAIPQRDMLEALKAIEAEFPEGCFEAVGVSPDGSETILAAHTAGVSHDSRFLVVAQVGGADPKLRFEAVRLRSCREIPEATVEWVNYGK